MNEAIKKYYIKFTFKRKYAIWKIVALKAKSILN